MGEEGRPVSVSSVRESEMRVADKGDEGRMRAVYGSLVVVVRRHAKERWSSGGGR